MLYGDGVLPLYTLDLSRGPPLAVSIRVTYYVGKLNLYCTGIYIFSILDATEYTGENPGNGFPRVSTTSGKVRFIM